MPTADIVSRAAGYSRHMAATHTLAGVLALGAPPDRTDAIEELLQLFADPSFASPGLAGAKHGSVTWTGASGGLYQCPWTGRLRNTNLMLYSQRLDEATWGNVSTTVTTSQAAPDGTMTAAKLVSTVGNTGQMLRAVTRAAVSQLFTGSVFLKAAGRTTALVLMSDGGANYGQFTVDLATGAISSIVNSGTFTGTAGYACEVTGQPGWYRVVFTGTLPAVGTTVNFWIWKDTANGDGTSGVYAWGAQLEPGDQATDYTPTLGAAQAAPCYVRRAMPGFTVPRIPSVLRNGLVNSQDFSTAAWDRQNITLGTGFAAPDGTMTATRLIETAVTNQHYMGANATMVQVGAYYVLSIYAKAAERTWIRLALNSSSNAAYFNLGAGAVGTLVGSGTVASIESAGNGWYRCSVAVLVSSVAGYEAYIFMAKADAEPSYLGDVSNGVLVWGAQIEPGTTARTYLPTTGVARAALDAPFRHDYRIGQNMLVNSAWDGAVAGSPGTTPTGWTMTVLGTPALAVDGRALRFRAVATGDRHILSQSPTLAANSVYTASVRVVALGTTMVSVGSCILWLVSSLPAGAAVTYKRNGVVVADTDVCAAGDLLTATVTTAAAGGTALLRYGVGCSGGPPAGTEATLTEPQLEPGTVRSVYTPTTSAAISAVVCEPVKANEGGVSVAWHAQGARTNLITAGAIAVRATTAYSGITRIITEDTSSGSHYVFYPNATLTDGATYTLRAKVRRLVGSRNIAFQIVAATSAVVASVNLDTLALTPALVGSGALTNASVTRAADGDVVIAFNLSATAWGGAVAPRVDITGASGAGDGVSALAYTLTVEAASFAGVPLGEGVTRAADVIRWNLAGLMSPSEGYALATYAPYLHAGLTGNYQYLLDAPDSADAPFAIYRGNSVDVANSLRGTVAGGGNPLVKAAPSFGTLATGQMVTIGRQWKSGAHVMHINDASVASSAGVDLPADPVSALYIGVQGSGSYQNFGLNVPFLFSGRLAVDREKALLSSAFVGKTQAVAA